MTELERLTERLYPKDGPCVRNFHVSWGPVAAGMTVEERAAELNRAMDEIDSGRARLITNIDED